MDEDLIIIVSVLSAAWGLLAVLVLVLWCQLSRVKAQLKELQSRPAMRVQKLTLDSREGNHAFHNPDIAPNEELSKRGYSMYVGDEVESQRGTERQTGGQFVEELAKELESRQLRHEAPTFLLQSVEDKRRTRELANPLANQNQTTQMNNQSKSKEQNYQNGKVQRQNSQIQNESGRNQRQNSQVQKDDREQKQQSFLHTQSLQNFNTHLYNHNQRSTRASDTNPNFIY